MTTRGKLTEAQKYWLSRAAELKRGQHMTFSLRQRSAVFQLLRRLKDRGLVEGPPWQITPAGRAALNEAEA